MSRRELDAMVVYVMPWLGPRDLSALACTCSALASATRTLHRLRTSDITRGLEPLPVPAMNNVDDIFYPLFSYCSTSFRGPIPRQPWGRLSIEEPTMDYEVADTKVYGVNADVDWICSHEVEHDCVNKLCSAAVSDVADFGRCNPHCDTITSDDTEPNKRLKMPKVSLCGRMLDGSLAYDVNSRLACLKSEDRDETLPVMVVIECGVACGCDRSCKNRVSQHGLTLKLCVVKHSLKGWGLHAAEHIPRGSFICEYAGELLTSEEATYRQRQYDARRQVEKSFVPALLVLKEHLPSGKSCLRWNIDATESGNVARFINHACDGGNLVTCLIRQTGSILPKVAFFARIDIKDQEELTFSYGDARDGLGDKLCFCGTAECVGLMPLEAT